jgi:hypothetical protein
MLSHSLTCLARGAAGFQQDLPEMLEKNGQHKTTNHHAKPWFFLQLQQAAATA